LDKVVPVQALTLTPTNPLLPPVKSNPIPSVGIVWTFFGPAHYLETRRKQKIRETLKPKKYRTIWIITKVSTFTRMAILAFDILSQNQS